MKESEDTVRRNWQDTKNELPEKVKEMVQFWESRSVEFISGFAGLFTGQGIMVQPSNPYPKIFSFSFCLITIFNSFSHFQNSHNYSKGNNLKVVSLQLATELLLVRRLLILKRKKKMKKDLSLRHRNLKNPNWTKLSLFNLHTIKQCSPSKLKQAF